MIMKLVTRQQLSAAATSDSVKQESVQRIINSVNAGELCCLDTGVQLTADNFAGLWDGDPLSLMAWAEREEQFRINLAKEV